MRDYIADYSKRPDFFINLYFVTYLITCQYEQ